MHLPTPLHPTLQRAVTILEPYFVKYVIPAKGGHGLLATPERWNKDVLDTLPPAAQSVKETLSNRWNNHKMPSTSSPQEKWNELQYCVKVCIEDMKKKSAPKKSKTKSSKEEEELKLWTTELVLKHTYPRLDVNVTKMQNHLLKSPFCVHPKTGRVCVYIPRNNNNDMEQQPSSSNNQNAKKKKKKKNGFDPFSVPTLAQVIQELDDYNQQHPTPSVQAEDDDDDVNMDISSPAAAALRYDWQKTSLRPYLEAFEKEFLQPLLKDLRQEQRQAQDEEEAQRGDF
jgi:DNA primase small subunit